MVYCETCGKAIQKEIEWPLFDGTGRTQTRVVNVVCDCIIKKDHETKQRLEQEEQLRTLQSLRKVSMMDYSLNTASFAGYEITQENKKPYTIALNYLNNFEKMKENGQGLLMWGDVGTGKSYTAACIANGLLSKNRPVVMISIIKLVELSGNESFEDAINNMCKADLLIIDDLGAERSTDYVLEKVYNVIDTRYRIRKPMIITTNVQMREMKETADIRYSRIYDRLFEMCYPVKFTGQSMRKKEASKRYYGLKELLEHGIEDI